MKPYGLFHSNSQLLVQQLVAVIGWQVNTVETADKSTIIMAGNGHIHQMTYQVWALGKLTVGWSTRWMVNSLGPAAPVDPAVRRGLIIPT